MIPSIRKWSLLQRAYALLVVVSVLPPLLVTALLLERERTSSREANVALLTARADEMGHTLEAMNRGHLGAARRAARDHAIIEFCRRSPAERRPDIKAIQEHLGVLRGDDRAVRGLGVMDRSGIIIAASEPALLGHNVAYRDYFQGALRGDETTSDPYLSVPATGRTPTIAYAMPVRSADRAIVGVFVLWLDMRSLWEVMRAGNGQAGPGSFSALFDRYGIRVAHSLNEALLFRPSMPVSPEAARAMLANRRFQERTEALLEEVIPFPFDEIRGVERRTLRRLSPTNHVWNLAVARHFPVLGWTLVMHVPESSVEVRLASLLPHFASASLAGLALSLLGGVLFMRQFVQPIRRLARATVELERGSFDPRHTDRTIDLESAGEVGELARAFRSMTLTLADRDQRLRERNCDLQQVLDNVGQGFLAIDRDGAISQVRSAIVDQWFGEPRAGEPIWSYLGGEDHAFADRLRCAWGPLFAGTIPLQAIQAEAPRLERAGRTFDLAYQLVEAQGRAERVVLVISDVTDALARERSERQMQAGLQQAQKLEAVGRLAAGIAHEINTPIQYIGDNTRFLEEAFGSVSELLRLHQKALEASAPPAVISQELSAARERAELDYLLEQGPKSIARTLEGLQRVATIVRAMKEFAHPDQKEMVATDLNRALLATLEVARNEYKYVADVGTELGELPLVTCHAGDLNQVFLNVIVNAAHAIEDVVKGTQCRGAIRVETRREGASVVVAISDTGGGIPTTVRDRIFDPFFTTKDVGRGSGQGLAIARSVVGQHKGSLTFDTREGEGTTFFIRIPINPKAAEQG